MIDKTLQIYWFSADLDYCSKTNTTIGPKVDDARKIEFAKNKIGATSILKLAELKKTFEKCPKYHPNIVQKIVQKNSQKIAQKILQNVVQNIVQKISLNF